MSWSETHHQSLEHQVARLKDDLRAVEHQRNWLGVYMFFMAFAVLALSPKPLVALAGLALLALSARFALK